MRDPDERVCAREDEGVVAEDVRHRNGGDQHRAHRGEHRDPHRAFLRVDRVRQPRVRGPRPPEHSQHQQPLDDARPGRVLDDQARHLRDRKHEDEVEEELERRDPLLGALLPSSLDSHRASVSFGMRMIRVRFGMKSRRRNVLGGARQGRRERRYAGISARLRTPHRAVQHVSATQSFISKRALRAAAWAAALSGIPSTAHALATGRDPFEAARAAGTILLPRETRPQRLLAAAVPVHLGHLPRLDDRARPRRRPRRAAWRDRGPGDRRARPRLAARRYPRIRRLPLGPQLADHAAFGAIAGRLL